MQSNAIFQKTGNYAVVEVPDGFVISDSGGDQVHFLNSTAAIVYEMCDGANTVDAISQSIDEIFALEQSSLQDVAACLQALESKALVRKSGPLA